MGTDRHGARSRRQRVVLEARTVVAVCSCRTPTPFIVVLPIGPQRVGRCVLRCNGAPSPAVAFPINTVAGAVAFSRVYTGVHYRPTLPSWTSPLAAAHCGPGVVYDLKLLRHGLATLHSANDDNRTGRPNGSTHQHQRSRQAVYALLWTWRAGRSHTAHR